MKKIQGKTCPQHHLSESAHQITIKTHQIECHSMRENPHKSSESIKI